jgi:hypothetical protein
VDTLCGVSPLLTLESYNKTVVSDALAWTLALFKNGKLPKMLERAGYPTIAAALDEDLVAAKVCEVESTLQAMTAASATQTRGDTRNIGTTPC